MKYRYYLTERPVDLGTFPKNENLIKVQPFMRKEHIILAEYDAYGYVEYKKPLSEKEINDFELKEMEIKE